MKHRLICLITHRVRETRASSLDSSLSVWDKGPFTRWSVEGVCQGYEWKDNRSDKRELPNIKSTAQAIAENWCKWSPKRWLGSSRSYCTSDTSGGWEYHSMYIMSLASRYMTTWRLSADMMTNVWLSDLGKQLDVITSHDSSHRLHLVCLWPSDLVDITKTLHLIPLCLCYVPLYFYSSYFKAKETPL